MLLPESANDLRIQQRGITQPLVVQQGLGPIAQRPAQPFAQRNTKSHLRPFDERAWNVPVQHLPQNPFCGVVTDLCIARQPPRKFDDAVIEERNARFQRHSHAGAVDFGQDVVRQISDEIENSIRARKSGNSCGSFSSSMMLGGS